MRKYPGLIPGPQTLIGFQKPYWQYGNIINGQKQIDPVLHFGCFVLGFNRWDIVDYVSNNMKKSLSNAVNDFVTIFADESGEISIPTRCYTSVCAYLTTMYI